MLKPTRGGNYKVDEEDLLKALSLKDIHAEVLGAKRLDEFIGDRGDKK
jgi:hypothetical protein